MGNHEEQMLDGILGDGRMVSGWLFYGGKETLRSYGVSDEIISTEYQNIMMRAARSVVPHGVLMWLRSLPLSRRTGDYLFVLAGARRGVPLDQQDPADPRWLRRDFLNSDEDPGALQVHGPSVRPES